MKPLLEPTCTKLNLFLHVTGRRADGYHLIESVFMLIDWCDTLHMSRRDDGSISREDLGAALPADDLVLRAARALQVASGCQYGAHIGIDKRIPAQAGLGGGSSDAATTLLALNRLWQLNWPLEKLLPIGLSLGADVPFFLHGHNAWVRGIGEIIEAIELPEAEFLVAKPAAGLSTSAIFCHPGLERKTGTAILRRFLDRPFDFGRNDLQSVAQKICPGVGQALHWLGTLGLSGRMTGSGSAVFAHLGQPLGSFGDFPFCQSRVCKNLPEHPLAGWAAGTSI
ncbi:MAG: 4-(cytidine 5'-diphospho)-2-C-methyl-D-erythritol kinase [Burkholderiales bacterium]|nr:4-(cytidine 5'-diphospho)-2-C-methyl-D-erythritol kinase [Burkholderiales bacterium]